MKFAVYLTLAAAIFGCKPQPKDNGNDNKSVDALLSGDQSQRSNVMCGDENAANQTSSDAIRRVYNALPVGIKTILDTQGKLSGSITVAESEKAALRGIENVTDRPSIAQVCFKILKEQNKDQRLNMQLRLESIKGCWRGRQVGGQALPEIFIERDLSAVHSGLIPMVVYGVTEMYFDGILGARLGSVGEETRASFTDEEKELALFYQTFVSLRDDLARDVVLDLQSQKLGDTLTKYESLYGRDYQSSLDFKNYVLAELVDSYYCSQATRAEFDQTRFPRARSTFARVVDFFGPSAIWP